ncbi:MAG: monovalent cation/H(+) antiporter subunit G [Phycisphaeraceae bacterium]
MNVLLDIVVMLLAVVGTAFAVLAAVGLVRLPDLYTRMQAASKGSTLGAIGVLLAAGVHFGEGGIIVRALLVVAFLMLTVPIAAHLIARAGYLDGVRMESSHVMDDLAGKYNTQQQRLEGEQEESGQS